MCTFFCYTIWSNYVYITTPEWLVGGSRLQKQKKKKKRNVCTVLCMFCHLFLVARQRSVAVSCLLWTRCNYLWGRHKKKWQRNAKVAICALKWLRSTHILLYNSVRKKSILDIISSHMWQVKGIRKQKITRSHFLSCNNYSLNCFYPPLPPVLLKAKY